MDLEEEDLQAVVMVDQAEDQRAAVMVDQAEEDLSAVDMADREEEDLSVVMVDLEEDDLWVDIMVPQWDIMVDRVCHHQDLCTEADHQEDTVCSLP